MKTHVRLALFVFVLTTILLAACAPIVGRVFSTVNASLGAQDAQQAPPDAAPQKDGITNNSSVAAGESSELRCCCAAGHRWPRRHIHPA